MERRVLEVFQAFNGNFQCEPPGWPVRTKPRTSNLTHCMAVSLVAANTHLLGILNWTPTLLKSNPCVNRFPNIFKSANVPGSLYMEMNPCMTEYGIWPTFITTASNGSTDYRQIYEMG